MKKILIISILGLLITSCVDLDIPPKDKVTDEDLMTNQAGMKIYLARMYSLMPFEDYKYMGEWGFRGSSWLGAFGIDGTGEALNRDGITRSFTDEADTYWNSGPVTAKPFYLLRDANYLMKTLPNYKDNFAEVVYEHYLGEAYFVRAFVFYTMAKRFGGVPLVKDVIPYPAESDVMEVPRASEEETWDQIMLDFKEAARLLQPKSLVQGSANKYVALSYLAEAMLYGGCVAKYNETVLPGRLTGIGEKTGVRVIGFAEDRWEAAAKRYFTAAYEAAREVMTDGGYSLYKKKWSATDRAAQYQNMVDMFSDLSSPENILVKEYMAPSMLHGIDAYSGPYIFRSPLSAGTCPTLDFVELFDGFERNANGTIKVLGDDGKYLMFDTPMDFFKNAEPRLRAYVLLPGDTFKGKEIEVRAGVYTGTDFSPLLGNRYDYANSGSANYQDLPIAKGDTRTLWLSSNSTQTGNLVVPGLGMYASGENGPYYDNPEATVTGFYLRKWLNTNPSFVPGEGKSDQPFVLMRYADVLLAAAEAGVELSMLGVSSPDGSNMLQVATSAINLIRERAGAELLTSQITSTEAGRDIVRKERRKELAFEHKTKWDLRRWRVIHYENRHGFWGESNQGWTANNSSTNSYRFRGLYPFYSSETGKYFFDARFQWISLKTLSYNTLDYYFSIPSGEVNKSPVIDQQPNR